MARSAQRQARKKPAKPYHHGDLRHALLDEALGTIQTRGVEHLTLRTVGEGLWGLPQRPIPAFFRQAGPAGDGRERRVSQAVASRRPCLGTERAWPDRL